MTGAQGVFDGTARQVRGGWELAAIVACFGLAVIALFHETVESMVTTWTLSETFTHGFLILPISLWLIWRKRKELVCVDVQPQWILLIPILVLGLLWLLAYSVEVNVIEQLAFVGVLVVGIWSILGTAFAKQIAFPLAFLFLAVPMGEELIPPLMEFTADTTEFLVRASGVPVYREGTFLALPSGNWSVVEACSGVRYLIASSTLGLLYAYLNYVTFWRQAAFVLLSVVVPIVANSLRAYGIVMIGHLSDMELATGVDHLVYGWVFFGAVMLLLFWIGSYWVESDQCVVAAETKTASPITSYSAGGCVRVAGAAALVAAIAPGLAFAFAQQTDIRSRSELTVPIAALGWAVSVEYDWGWQPRQLHAARELDAYYVGDGKPVELLLRQYLDQHPGSELVVGRQTWRLDRKSWRVAHEGKLTADLDGPVEIDEARLVSAQNELLVWAWYLVDRKFTSNPYLAKLLEAKYRILEGHREGTRIFIATPVQGADGVTAARDVLQIYLDAHLEEIVRVLGTKAGEECISADVIVPCV